MAQRTVEIPGIGRVILAKRKGTRHLRLSITADGRVMVGLPAWTPYSVGINFAQSRKAWIHTQLESHSTILLKENDLIGKAHRLHFHPPQQNSRTTRTKVNSTSVNVYTSLAFDSTEVQAKAGLACERALRAESENLLLLRLAELARLNDYSYKQMQIRKFKSRWGSCSTDKVISLSLYLIQLPWPLIDYVILHELTHTRQMNHSQSFWEELNRVLPTAKEAKKAIKGYKPRVMPAD